MAGTNLTDIIALLKEANDYGIKVFFENNNLLVHTPDEQEIDEHILNKLRANKEHLVSYFSKHTPIENRSVADKGIQPYDRNVVKHVPLSFSQERLWFIDQLEGSISYHLPNILRLKGTLNREALAYAFQEIVNRHEVLRTVMTEEAGVAYQQVLDKGKWNIKVTDDPIYKQNEKALEEYLRSLIEVPFDLQKDHMLRADLICLSADEHVLLVTLHHIASDGWSTGIIVPELVELYQSFVEGRPAQLLPLTIQYADYAIWQRENLSATVLKEKLDYWKGKLKGSSTLELPIDYVRPIVQSTHGASRRYRLDPALSDQLQALSLQQGSTLFMTLLAAFNVLLYRYSGQPDICVGSPIAGRTRQEAEGLVGFFINTLVLRNHLDGDPSFISLLEQVKQTTLDAYDHQEVPFEKVVEAVAEERYLNRTPLFQVMFELQNVPEAPALHLNGLHLFQEETKYTSAQFDLTFSIRESTDGLEVLVIYGADLFNEATLDRMMAHYEQLLRAVIKTPTVQISQLFMISAAEEYQLLHVFNDTQVDYPQSKTFITLFDEQAKSSPDAIAVTFGAESLTYKTLSVRANQLAHHLRKLGVKANTLVPVCIERSPDMIIGILGIMKAGAAYVPVDLEYPAERIRYILEDCEASIVVSSSYGKQKIELAGFTNIIALDIDRELIDQQPETLPETIPGPHHLAYVIYTSGSTGKPKGVMVEHQGMLNHLFAKVNDLKIDEGTILAYTAAYTFDISVWQMFAALLCGGRTIIYSEETIFQPAELVNAIDNDRVTILELVPSYLNALLQENTSAALKHLRFLVVTGEAVSRHLLMKWFGHKDYGTIPVVNAYGPTEASDDITHYLMNNVPDYTNIPVGKPIQNMRIYVLNNEQQLCPVGVPGEIFVSGVGVARGYLNLEQLTTEKFIKDPFSKESAARMYRTGDVGRWLPDGNLEYLGRTDDQVKIRGLRIELGEIENALLECDLVKEAIVTVRTGSPDDNGNDSATLTGYIVPNGGFDRAGVLTYLKEKLPEYMIPYVLVALDKLPLTANGKIDKQALPDPVEADGLPEYEYVGPGNETERMLTNIWQELLGIERVSIRDNFFRLGGNSLMAIRLISSVYVATGLKIPVRTFFQLSTIEALARYTRINLNQHTLDATYENLEMIEL
ncbi:amino acid adenylation domain-containing protein [Chitinophaga sp. G-6-1-13]|uniref:Amino acid adenylation domain-containing protein n=1 Tax=Chitinophaga fulva TaxID=2728842 RepID=A0A848GQK3_9BACT|nr:non-ribosomal peptide synthetase [Chitinophaga fulva]NML38920.1 amino acid adenylation domain-containing protein [Chitinophaga fulva]